MIFKTILAHAEPYALDLAHKPLCVNVRAQVIASFVALGLGKGGLFISSFLFAMAWLDAKTYLAGAIVCAVATMIVMAVGYIATFGRIKAAFDADAGTVELTHRAPFYRRTQTLSLAGYRGIEMHLGDNGFTALTLVHDNPGLNAPLCHRRLENPKDQAMSYGRTLGVAVFNPVELKLSGSRPV